MRGILVIGFLFVLIFPVRSQNSQTVHLAAGDSILLRAGTAHAVGYQWYRDNQPVINHHDQFLVVKTPGSYKVVALGAYCDSDMSDPVTVILTTHAGPRLVDMMIHNQPDRNAALLGQTISYQITTTNKGDVPATLVTVKITLPASVSYGMISGGYPGQAIYDPILHEITWIMDRMEPGQSEALSFSVHADQEGLANQLAVVSSAEDDLFIQDNQSNSSVDIVALKIPNVFTPNGDGINDVFEIVGLQFMQHSVLTVFNVHGYEVYRSENYQNDWAGQHLNPGVYFYMLEIQYPNGKKQTLRGSVTIFK